MVTTPTTTRRRSSRSVATTPGETSVASQGSSTSSSKKRPGVPWNIQKEFAQELEAKYPLAYCSKDGNSVKALLNAGGAQALAFFLDELVDRAGEDQDERDFRTIKFGARGDPIREKLGDLVQNWKKKKKEDYRKHVLIKLGIKQESARKKPRQVTEEESDLSESSCSNLTSGSIATTGNSSTKKANSAEDPLLGRTVTSSNMSTSKKITTSPVKMGKADGDRNGITEKEGILTKKIYVDLDHPERIPYPFKVLTSMALKGKLPESAYQGFLISIRVHPCDAMGQDSHQLFPFTATRHTNHEIDVEAPVLDYTDLGMDDEVLREKFELDDEGYIDPEDKVIMDACDNARNKREERFNAKAFPTKLIYRLVFPVEVQLSGSVLDANQGQPEDGLTLTYLPIDYQLQMRTEKLYQDLTWDDIETKTVRLSLHDDDGGTTEEKEVHVFPQPVAAVDRFVIQVADLSKESFVGGKPVKPVDTSGVTQMMNALGKRKKKKRTVTLSEDESSPAKPPTAQPDSLSFDEVIARVSAACALVAAELSVTQREVLDNLVVEDVYEFAFQKNIDLVTVVRETHKRTTEIRVHLDALAVETNYDRVKLAELVNWFDIYEYAVQGNHVLMDVMRDYLLQSKQTTQPGSFWTTNKKTRVGLEERDLKRLEAFKAAPDGRTERLQRNESRQSKKRDDKLNAKRGIGGKG